jgi:hypothetical protein
LASSANVASDLYPGHPPANFYNPISNDKFRLHVFQTDRHDDDEYDTQNNNNNKVWRHFIA